MVPNLSYFTFVIFHQAVRIFDSVEMDNSPQKYTYFSKKLDMHNKPLKFTMQLESDERKICLGMH